MFRTFILSISLILLGLLSLLSLALSAIGLMKKQKSLRMIGLIAFLCFACLFACGSVYTGKKAVDKVYTIAQTLPSKVWNTAAKIISEGLIVVWNDDRTSLTSNPQTLLLKSYMPDTALSTINPQYYTYFGFRDWWRFPLVYPYSIHTIDMIDFGYLYDESKVTDFANGINDSESLGIRGITHLALDKDYLLLRVQNDDCAKESQVKFIIFNFNTREKQVFDSEDEMFERARELGFKSKLEFVTLRQYDALFSENKQTN